MRQRMDTRVLNRGGRTDGAGLADTLRAQGVVRAGGLGRGGNHLGDLANARDEVVDHRGGTRRALVVEDDFLEHCLPDALRDAAMHLSLGEQRVDDAAAIVDREKADQARIAGLGIYLDHGAMCTKRVAAVTAKSPIRAHPRLPPLAQHPPVLPGRALPDDPPLRADPRSRDLAVARRADPGWTPAAPLAPPSLLGAQLPIVRELQQLVQGPLVLA